MNIKMNREARYDIVYAQPEYVDGDGRLRRLEQRQAFNEGVQAGQSYWRGCLDGLVALFCCRILIG